MLRDVALERDAALLERGELGERPPVRQRAGSPPS